MAQVGEVNGYEHFRYIENKKSLVKPSDC